MGRPTEGWSGRDSFRHWSITRRHRQSPASLTCLIRAEFCDLGPRSANFLNKSERGRSFSASLVAEQRNQLVIEEFHVGALAPNDHHSVEALAKISHPRPLPTAQDPVEIAIKRSVLLSSRRLDERSRHKAGA